MTRIKTPVNSIGYRSYNNLGLPSSTMTNIALARGSVAIERAFIFLISSGGEKSCDLELYVKKDFSPPARNHGCERGRDGITGAKSFLDPAQRYCGFRANGNFSGKCNQPVAAAHCQP